MSAVNFEESKFSPGGLTTIFFGMKWPASKLQLKDWFRPWSGCERGDVHGLQRHMKQPDLNLKLKSGCVRMDVLCPQRRMRIHSLWN